MVKLENKLKLKKIKIGILGGSFDPAHQGHLAISKEAHKKWRLIPAPKRGEIIREFGNELRNQKADLAQVITKEARKIVSEAEGEVQEAIDMCDFANACDF